MEQKFSCCGIICDECPAYKATIDNDDELRKNTAQLLKEKFNIDIRPEQVNCLGCRSETTIAFSQSCAIKACNLQRLVIWKNILTTVVNVIDFHAIK